MRQRALGVMAGIAATTIVLTGCVGQPDPAPTTRPTASSTPNPLEPSRFTPAPSGVPLDTDSGGGTVEPEPVPTWDAQQRSAAIAAAENALTSFVRPDLSSTDWWNALSPLLTTQAQQDYRSVDPANIPARQLTGPGTIVDDRSAYVVSVNIPTDAGTYGVLLTRLDGAAPWLASRFTPPDGTH